MSFSRWWSWAVIASVVLVAAAVLVTRAEEGPGGEPAGVSGIPVESRLAYKVVYLGITCGHMTLESRLEEYQGKPAYHIIMTARNTSFFNKIYRVDGRIDSWVDVETMSTLAYLSDITEKGKRKIKRYIIDREAGVVRAEKHGKKKIIPFDTVLKKPRSFVGQTVTFVAQFHRLGEIDNPFHTKSKTNSRRRFTAQLLD